MRMMVESSAKGVDAVTVARLEGDLNLRNESLGRLRVGAHGA
jgi:hypothetical protein